jgi:ComF family protein
MPDHLARASALVQAFLDLVYPPRCAGCGRMGTSFCERCQAQVEFIVPPVCRLCGRPQPKEGICSRCRALPSSLDAILTVGLFSGPLRHAVHALKYKNNATLAAPLGALMVDLWRQGDLPHADLIVPVPLHSRREAERGYNQAILLARALGRGVGVPVDESTLIRQRPTPPQVGLSLAQRRENVEGAFACRGDLRGKSVVVVDDVCTTGATLEACAASARVGGADAVWAFTLARARWDPAHGDFTPDIDRVVDR